MYKLKTAIIFFLIIFFRYLPDAGYEDNIVKSEKFLTSRGVLESQRNELKQMGKGNNDETRLDCLREKESYLSVCETKKTSSVPAKRAKLATSTVSKAGGGGH